MGVSSTYILLEEIVLFSSKDHVESKMLVKQIPSKNIPLKKQIRTGEPKMLGD